MMQIPRVIDLLDLRGKVALVTGSGRGIGSCIARRLAEAGADVAVHCLHSLKGAENVALEIQNLGRRSVVLQADLACEKDVDKMMAEVVESLGRLDILVNNAGSYPVHLLHEMEIQEWKQVLDDNLMSAFLCTRAAARQMISQKTGGAIVNISSIEAVNPAPGHAHYTAAKAAVEQLSCTAALELGKHNIRVNIVAPGLIWSETLEENWSDGVQRWMQRVPLGRLGHPEDVADACLFLCSDASRWITGATLTVDGGILTCQAF